MVFHVKGRKQIECGEYLDLSRRK